MNKIFKRLSSIFALTLALIMTIGSTAYADGTRLDYMDFGDTVLSIRAGESKTSTFRSLYHWTYYITGATSKGTYLETDFSTGQINVTYHIGADETGKNVFFHFYIDDEAVANDDIHDFVEIYVQPAATTIPAAEMVTTPVAETAASAVPVS